MSEKCHDHTQPKGPEISFEQHPTRKPEILQRVSRICVEKKNQLDVTEWFIALILHSTCFGHFYAHHQELETACVLLPPMVGSALVAGCRRSSEG
jgi:hypothetical protein